MLKLYYKGNSKALLSVLDQIEKRDDLTDIYVLTTDLKKLAKDFFELFRVVEAAGGLVVNRQSEVLLIFRLDHWDLPKGKIDAGETQKQAALREVREETGLGSVSIVKKMHTTHHIYRTPSNKRILKPSYWYLMSTPEMDLTPQYSENIEKAVWVASDHRLLNKYRPVYPSILSLLGQYVRSIEGFTKTPS